MSEPGRLWVGSVVIETKSSSFHRLVKFWCDALHYVPREPLGDWALLRDPTRSGPNIAIQRTEEEDEVSGPRGRIHLDLYSTSLFPNQVRLELMLWNSTSQTDDWIFDSVDLTDTIRAGDVCRAVYWKTAGWQYVKMNVYRNGNLVFSRLDAKQLTVSQDIGVLKKMTMGAEHREANYKPSLCSNSVFQHVSVEDSTIDEAQADSFLETGIRPQSASTIARWDLSQGNDLVYLRY